MVPTFAILLALHGLIHLLGFVKAFRLAELPQLTLPVSRPMGVVWLVAAALFIASAITLVTSPRWWWLIGACAIVVSMAAIVPSWSDAKAGALVNVVVLAGVVFGALAYGPGSLRAAYDREVAERLARAAEAPAITDADLAGLPAQVQRYLRASGGVGQPRVRNFRVRMHGRIRSGPDASWMPFSSEQHNVLGEPARLFYMNASMFLLPVQGLHRYADGDASMRVKAAALVPVVDLSGQEMTRAETVTLFNDMCIMAPATLVDPAIVWEEIDTHTVRATFTNAGHTIHADLVFDDRGELIDFWSDDRFKASPDGRTMTKTRWSTPLSGYRAFGAVRLASRGEGRWHEPGGDYAYLELEIDEVQYNVTPRQGARPCRPGAASTS